MANITDLKLDLPNYGSTGWGATLNKDLEQIQKAYNNLLTEYNALLSWRALIQSTRHSDFNAPFFPKDANGQHWMYGWLSESGGTYTLNVGTTLNSASATRTYKFTYNSGGVVFTSGAWEEYATVIIVDNTSNAGDLIKTKLTPGQAMYLVRDSSNTARWILTDQKVLGYLQPSLNANATEVTFTPTTDSLLEAIPASLPWPQTWMYVPNSITGTEITFTPENVTAKSTRPENKQIDMRTAVNGVIGWGISETVDTIIQTGTNSKTGVPYRDTVTTSAPGIDVLFYQKVGSTWQRVYVDYSISNCNTTEHTCTLTWTVDSTDISSSNPIYMRILTFYAINL